MAQTLRSAPAATLGTSTSATISVFNGNGTWNSSSGSLWGNGANSNWTDANGVHAAPGTFAGFTNIDTAAFCGSGSVTAISLTGANPSLAALSFSGSNYTLSDGTLTLSSAGTASITVSGTQSISSLLNLASSADMIVSGSADLLELSGPITGSNPLLKDGAGELILSNSGNSYSGGTSCVNSGTLIVASGGAPYPPVRACPFGAGASLVFDATATGSPIIASPLCGFARRSGCGFGAGNHRDLVCGLLLWDCLLRLFKTPKQSSLENLKEMSLSKFPPYPSIDNALTNLDATPHFC